VLHVDGREYIATAKHFAELLVNEVELYHEGGWVRTSVTLVGHNSLADVSVLALPESFVDTEMIVEMTQAGMIYGGEVFFLGFPFGLSSQGGDVTRGFPIPFVKRAIVANFATPDLGADFWLDGHNNVGFSGGPIVSIDRANPARCTLRGFVCSWYAHPEEVEGSTEAASATYYANSGLIMAAGVNRALDLIASNPIGPLVGLN
jgi:hypothetical protein